MAFDRKSASDRAALRGEVENDPSSLGYDSAGGTSTLVKLLNSRTANTGAAAVSLFDARAILRSIETDDFVPMVVAWETYRAELLAFKQGIVGAVEPTPPSYPPLEHALAYTSLLLRAEDMGINTDSAQEEGLANRRLEFREFWPTGSGFDTRTALNNETVVPSRAEELFGTGTKLSNEDWLFARDNT